MSVVMPDGGAMQAVGAERGLGQGVRQGEFDHCSPVVVMPVRSGDEEACVHALTDLATVSGLPSSLRLLGYGADGARMRAEVARAGVDVEFLEVGALARSTAGRLAWASRTHPGRDVIQLLPGVELPQQWDARLALSARESPGVATASPLCDVLPVFDAFLSGDRRRARRIPAQQVDEWLLALAPRQNLFAPAFLPVCVYFRAEAVRSLGHGLETLDDADADRAIARILVDRGWSHALAPHLFVRDCSPSRRRSLSAWRRDQDLRYFQLRHPATGLRHAMAEAAEKPPPARRALSEPVRVQLHISHSWGGGLGAWVIDYCRGDPGRKNLVLRSVGDWGRFGSRLALFGTAEDDEPIRTWDWSFPIRDVMDTQPEYREVLQFIVDEYRVDAIIVSSLIGHTLDVLRCPVETRIVAHDYFPFCPAVHIVFGSVCESCEPARLTRCFAQNEHNHFFDERRVSHWQSIRQAYVETIVANGVRLLVPSPSVRKHLTQLLPTLPRTQFRVIEHGRDLAAADTSTVPFDGKRKLRVVVLGHMTKHKGLDLLRAAIDDICEIADLYLVGCQQEGEELAGRQGVEIELRYDRDSLPQVLDEISPDLGLLASVWPETFSYTLAELTTLRVPVLATRMGAFSDRIEDGHTGFLFDPTPESLVASLAELHRAPEKLVRVRARLQDVASRSIAAMVADYHDELREGRMRREEYMTVAADVTRQPSGDLPTPVPLTSRSFGEVVEKFRSDAEGKIAMSPRLGRFARWLLRIGFNCWYAPMQFGLGILRKVRQ